MANLLVNPGCPLVDRLSDGSWVERVVSACIKYRSGCREDEVRVSYHGGADEIRRNLVPRKWVPDVLARVGRIRASRKRVVYLCRPSALVSSELRGSWNLYSVIGGLRIAESLVCPEEEGLVLSVVQFREPNRTSDNSAEFVLAKGWLGRTDWQEVGPSIEDCIARILKH